MQAVGLIVVCVAFIVGVFVLGVNFGNGEIEFGGAHFIQIGTSNSNLAGSLNYSQIQQEYNVIKNNFDGKLTTSELQDGIEHSLASSTGDPHTEYFTNTEANEFNDELNNTFSGIGAELDQNSSNQLVIVAPLADTPASKAGLQPKDIIETINGVNASNYTLDQAVSKIQGTAGTQVTLGILRGTVNMTFKITRATITIPSVYYKVIDNNIGYISISSFANDTSGLMQTAANTLKADKVKGIILDLRDNPGGLVQAAINVSSLWLPAGDTIVTEKHDNKVIQTYYSTGNDILQGIQTVILVNDGSASASEITSAALHDNHAASLIGQKTYGKGSVQELFPLAGGSEIKVTIYHWYTPDNKNIDKVGITPDITIVPTTADNNAGIDVQLNKAVTFLQNL